MPVEEVLGALPVHLVGVGALEGPGHEGDLDLLQHLLGALDGPRALEREEQGIEDTRVPLSAQRKDVVEVHVHHVVGVPHGGLPRLLDRRRQFRGRPDVRAQAVVEADVVGHRLDHAAGMLVPEAFQAAVAPTGIQGKDGFERRVPLRGRPPLLGRKGREPDHADISVAPSLVGDPLDGVVVVPLIVDAELTLRLVAASHLADHMNVAVGDETLRVAAFDHPIPLGRPGRLPDLEVLRHLHPLQILVVHGAGVEDGELRRGHRDGRRRRAG